MTQRPLQVLLVEDNPDDADFVMSTTADEFAGMFAWTHVNKAGQAEQRLCEKKFDLILVDLWLPDSEGFETFNRVHKAASGTPIVVLTGLLGHDLGPRAVEMGAEDFLLKDDADMSRIVNTLRLAAARRRRRRKTSIISPAEQGQSHAPQLPIDKYRLIRPLSEGALSTVYLAEEVPPDGNGTQYAFKLFHSHTIPEDYIWHFKKAFLHEAELTSHVDDPRIVRIIEHGNLPSLDLPFSVTRYVEGTTLDALMKDPQALTFEQKLKIIAEIGEALSVIHEHHLCHRDLKPHNVIITPSLDVVLTDFGTCKSMVSEDATRRAILGSPLYVSPETFFTSETDARSDIFSLGILTYELLLNQYPFHSNNMEDLREQICSGTVRLPQKSESPTHRPLRKILQRMMDSRIHRRYQSVRKVLADMQKVYSDLFPGTNTEKKHT